MSRREFLEVLRGQLSGQMTQGEKLRLMCGIMRITFSLSPEREVNQMSWQNWEIPADRQDFDRYR